MQMVSAFHKTATESFLKGVSTRHFQLQLANHVARSTVSSGFGLAFGLGLKRLWLAEVVGLVASTSVESAMDGGASFLGSAGRFSARTRCDLNSRRSSIHSRRRCKCPSELYCQTVRVDGLCVPHFLEVRTFSYVNLLLRRLAVVSPVGLRKLRLRPWCATCSRSVLPPKGPQAASLFRVRELEQTHVLFSADIMNRGGPFPRWR